MDTNEIVAQDEVLPTPEAAEEFPFELCAETEDAFFGGDEDGGDFGALLEQLMQGAGRPAGPPTPNTPHGRFVGEKVCEAFQQDMDLVREGQVPAALVSAITTLALAVTDIVDRTFIQNDITARTLACMHNMTILVAAGKTVDEAFEINADIIRKVDPTIGA